MKNICIFLQIYCIINLPIKLKFFARERTSSRVLFWKKRSVNKHNRANIRIFAGKKTYPHARQRQFMPHRFHHEYRRVQTKKGVQKRFCTPCILWSGREDSNFRPLAPHASALPGCATPRTDEHYISLSANVAYFHFILVN